MRRDTPVGIRKPLLYLKYQIGETNEARARNSAVVTDLPSPVQQLRRAPRANERGDEVVCACGFHWRFHSALRMKRSCDELTPAYANHLSKCVRLTAFGLGYFSSDFWYAPINCIYGPITQPLTEA